MSAMSDYAIFQATLDFVPLADIGCQCAECKDQYCGDWRSAPDGRLLCATCFDDQYFTCCDCEEIADNADATDCGDGQLCESCYSDHYFTCKQCDEIKPNDDCTEVDGDSWCHSCCRNDATQCADCDTWTRNGNTIDCGHHSICMSCYEDRYFTCESCDEVCHQDDYGENGRCQSCSPEDDNGSEILDYGADVLNVLGIHVNRNKLFYGVELEVTTERDHETSAHEVKEALGERWCITKHDGSLNGRGFEIVTRPATAADQLQRWGKFLESPPSALRSWESGLCGMHVHVSREPLSQLTIGKILVFINAPDNKDFVVGIAGRDSSQYAEFIPKKITDCKISCDKRGQSVNLQNSDTIEFRIFRGTLKKSAFLKNFEFVVATIKFCQQTGINQLDVDSFLDWFKPVRKDYPNLDSWLVSRSHIKPRSTKGGE